MPVYPELSGRHVVITGGANGIGEALVRAFHAQKATVYFCDLDAEAGSALARSLGPQCHFSPVNLQSEKAIRRWIAQVRKSAPTLHAVVNNAARDPRIPFDTMTSKQWDDLFASNLRAYFLVSQSALPALTKGSAIVNLASLTFHSAPTPMSAYVATKGGVIGFTRSLARELGPREIRVNTVSPGWVMTERQLRQFVTPAVKRLIRASQSLPGLIQPEEIADVVLFLASEGARAITGQEFLVDRGWMHS